MLRSHAVGLAALVGFLLTAQPATAVEVTPGAALRQTTLFMKLPTEGPVLPEGNFGITELRLRPYLRLSGEQWNAAFAVESRGNFTSLQTGGPGLDALSGGSLLGSVQPLRYFDTRVDHIEEPGTFVATDLERADVLLYLGPVDVDIGRQPISLGTSRFVGVLDVIAPFAPGDLDASYKPGVDAVRVRTGFGVMGEAEILAVAADPVTGGALLFRVRDSFAGFDIEAVAGRFRSRNFGGLGWEGDAGWVGLWGEAALFQRGNEPWRAGWRRAAFAGVAGIEKNLPGDIVTSLGVFYHDFGARERGMLSVLQDEPFAQGWVFLRSAGYGVVTAQYQAHPLITIGGSGLVNLVDWSTLWQPRVNISTGNNTEVTAFGWISSGAKPELAGTNFHVPTEFGAIPDGGGMYARWFF